MICKFCHSVIIHGEYSCWCMTCRIEYAMNGQTIQAIRKPATTNLYTERLERQVMELQREVSELRTFAGVPHKPTCAVCQRSRPDTQMVKCGRCKGRVCSFCIDDGLYQCPWCCAPVKREAA